MVTKKYLVVCCLVAGMAFTPAHGMWAWLANFLGANQSFSKVVQEQQGSWGSSNFNLCYDQRENNERVKQLLQTPIDPYWLDEKGYNSLMYAVEMGKIEIAQAILEKDIGLPTPTVFHNNKEWLVWDMPNPQGRNPFLVAYYNGYDGLALQLLRKCACVNRMEDKSNGKTLLMNFLEKGKEDLIEVLLEKDVDLMTCDFNGKGVGHYLGIYYCGYKPKETVPVDGPMMKSSQKPLFKYFSDRPSFFMDCEEPVTKSKPLKIVEPRNQQIVRLFLKKGYKIQSLLNEAVESNHVALVKFLLQEDTTLILSDKNLLGAIQNGWEEMISLLLEKGVKVSLPDEKQRSPITLLTLAFAAPLLSTSLQQKWMYRAEICKSGFYRIVRVLLQQGVDINAQDITGKTALMYAVKSNEKDLVEALLMHGADPDIICYDSKNVLQTPLWGFGLTSHF